MKSDRYQDQNLLVRMWRKLRYYPTIPFIAFGMWRRARKSDPFSTGEEEKWTFGMYWKLSKGIVQGNMNWTYTLEEVFAKYRPDNCEVCKGEKGGIRGNENIINGVVMCDYCHAEDMDNR